MCTFFEEIAKEGERRGRREGERRGRREGERRGRREGEVKGRAREIVETGFEFAMSKEDIIKRLQSKLDISIQKATEYFNRYGRQTM